MVKGLSTAPPDNNLRLSKSNPSYNNHQTLGSSSIPPSDKEMSDAELISEQLPTSQQASAQNVDPETPNNKGTISYLSDKPENRFLNEIFAMDMSSNDTEFQSDVMDLDECILSAEMCLRAHDSDGNCEICGESEYRKMKE